MGLAGVFAQSLGGLLIAVDPFGWGWRSCFIINIPIAAIAAVLAVRIVPESRAPRRPTLDVSGMILIASALLALILPLIEGRELGWPAWSFVMLAGAVVLFGAFALHESRLKHSGSIPLVDADLFREPSFAIGIVAQLIFFTSMASFYFVFAIYVQVGRGLTPLQAGTLFMANGLAYVLSSSVAGFAHQRFGRRALTLAALLRACGTTLLLLEVEFFPGASLIWFVPGLCLNGLGTGLSVSPLAATILSRVSMDNIGAASGVLTTCLQVGNALGIAIIGLIFYEVLGTDNFGSAFTASLAYIVVATLALCALVELFPGGREKKA